MYLGNFFSCQSVSSHVLQHLLLEGIKELVTCSLDPVAFVCDQGAKNQQLYITKLGITLEAPHFKVKIYDQVMHKMYALCDALHLLKCVHNNFKKYKVKFVLKGLINVAE